MDKLKTLVGLSIIMILIGCAQVTITGSGNVVTQEEEIDGFDKVDISSSFKAEINQGEEFQVVIRADDNLYDHLEVVNRGGTLRIGLDPGKWYILLDATMEVELTMPELRGLDLSGSSTAKVSGFKSTKSLTVDSSGNSNLDGELHAGDVMIDSSGSSLVMLSGSGGDLVVDSSGSSQVDLEQFTAVNGNVNASGSSTVTVNLSGRLDVDASGSSDIFYLGDLEFGSIETSGTSSVDPK